MAKLSVATFSSLTNQTSFLSQLNTAMTSIETAMENTLSRDGTSPNEMESQLDMNSNAIINLPAAAVATNPVRKAEFDVLDAEFDALELTVSAAVTSINSLINTYNSLALNGLSDVTLGSLTTNEVLAWNGSVWVNANLDTLVGSLTQLDDLNDVTVSSSVTSDIIYNSGSGWVNTTLPTLAGNVLDLADLANVSATTPTAMDVLYWTGTAWDSIAQDTLAGAAFLNVLSNLSDLNNAATARTNLGVAIGTDVQAWDAGLDDIAALAVTDGNIIVGNGTNWVAESGATARTSLDVYSTTEVLSGSLTLTNKTLTSPVLNTASVPDYVDFTPTAAPSHTEGRLYYDSTEKAFSYYNDEAEVTLNVGQENFIRVRNTTGADIPNGSAVYISGSTGANLPNISLAQANVLGTSRCIGLATHTIENNSNGYVCTLGIVRSLNTAGFSAGDALFLSPSTPGALTATRPTSGFALVVGYCTISNPSTGEIKVVPGTTVAPSNVASTDGTETFTNKTIDLGSNTVTMTQAQLDAAVSDGNVVYTDDIGVSVQAYDATIVVDADIGVTVQAYDVDTAKLDVAQSWTADQDFTAQLEISEELILDGLISPAQITANQNNYAPTGIGTANVVRVDSDADYNITGISASQVEGRWLVVQNDGSNILTLTHNDTVNSTAANCFDLLNDSDFQLGAGGAIILMYDGTASRWRQIGGAGSGGGATLSDTAPTSPTPTAGNFWVRTTDMALFIYYNDGNSSQWVEVGGGGATGPVFVDANGNEVLDVEGGTASAVNYLDINNSATGTGPNITAAGSDTNIDLNLEPKGTGRIKTDTYPIDAWHELSATTLTNSTTTAFDIDFRAWLAAGYKAYKLHFYSLAGKTASSANNQYLYCRKDSTDTPTPTFESGTTHQWFRHRTNTNQGTVSTGTNTYTYRETSTSLQLAHRYPAARTASVASPGSIYSSLVEMTFNNPPEGVGTGGLLYYPTMNVVQHGGWYAERSEGYGIWYGDQGPVYWLRFFQGVSAAFRSGVQLKIWGIK